VVSSASAGSVVIQVLPSFFRPADPTAYLALQHDQLTPERGNSASSRLLDLKSEAISFTKRNISAGRQCRLVSQFDCDEAQVPRN